MTDSAEKPQDYDLHATAVVGCGISLFFCFISIIAFIFFRPRTESFMIKQHLSAAVGITQIVLLLTIAAYRSNEGCQAMSVLLHYSATACFAWCCVDSLHLYFNHTNISNPLRKKIVYFLFGWGVPIIVVVMSLAIGFTTKGRRSPVLVFYTCWPTDNIVWAFVIPSLLIATLNLSILCVILHHLRQPSYDICARAVLERRATRYGLRTNSLMLLGLCLGWIFGILSFREVNNVRYQLTFGLINGLQGIFLFFFHCVLNTDIKGYYESGVHRCSHEDGCLTDRERSKRGIPQTQDLQVGSRRKISSKSKAEHVPLISVGTNAKKQAGGDSSRSRTADLKSDSKHFEVTVIQSQKTEQQKSSTETRTERPDQQAYPSLPGTPEPHVPDMDPRLPQRHTLPAQLVSKRNKKEVEGISKSATLTSLSSYKPSDGDKEHRQQTTDRLKAQSKVEKTNSEPVISPPAPEQQNSERSSHAAKNVTDGTDARKLSVQSSASSGGSERKPRRTSRSQQVSSLNELESLFSNPMYVKPHRQSLSSLHGSGGKERKLSSEVLGVSTWQPSSQGVSPRRRGRAWLNTWHAT